MNRGYVLTWRKTLDSGWLRNHKLWAFWSYCLLKATHREFDAIVGLQVVHLLPGQFIFGRKVASKETGLTEQEIRTVIAFLIKAGNLTIKTTNKFSIITIVNWHIYQPKPFENNQQINQQLTNKEPHTITKEHKNNNISSEIRDVLSHLNLQTGKKFRNTKHIEARLRDGATVDDCKRVIDTKIKDPYFIANPKYLNPETLFRPSNFDRYVNEVSPLSDNKTVPAPHECPRCGKRIIVESDLTEFGCIYCEMEARA